MGSRCPKTHLFKYSCNRVSHIRCWSQGKVNYPKRHAQSLCRLPCHKLSCPCYLESRFLYRLRYLIEALPPDLFKGRFDYPWTAHANIYYAVRLSCPMECSSHEGVVLNRVAKDHQLRAAYAVVFPCKVSSPLYYITHQLHCVHVYSGMGVADIHRRANPLGYRKGFRYGIYEYFVSL